MKKKREEGGGREWREREKGEMENKDRKGEGGRKKGRVGVGV
jgi:hypothetical protein